MEIRNTEVQVIISYEDMIKFIETETGKSFKDYEIQEIDDTGDDVRISFDSV